MSTSDGFRRHSRIARLSLLLMMAVLALALAGCDTSDTYELSISSTSGGSVTLPGEGIYTYEAGAVVELVAVPDDGYHFETWIGDIADITDPNAASTNITVNGDYSITASFEEGGGPSPSDPYD